MADLSQPLPAFDPAASPPNATINAYDTNPRPGMLPTWYPDATHRDVEIVKIAREELSGEYTAHPYPNAPTTLVRSGPAAFFESDELHSTEPDGGKHKDEYPYRK